MANETLKRLGEKVCSEYLGFIPTSNSTKPPHIANGLFRACTGETCNTNDVHEWVLSDGEKDAIPSDKLIEKYNEILENGFTEKPTNIKQFRYFLNEIFDQDNTLYPNYKYSVMLPSSHWMIKKRVPSEARIGDFIFEILAKKIDGRRSPTIDLLVSALGNDTDDLTKLVKPIIAYPSDTEKRTKDGVQFPADEEIKWDSCKETIRKGFDRLTANIMLTGEHKNSLLVLRRIVNFSMFATFLYLAQGNSALYGGNIPPIVLDAGADLDSVKAASEQTYTLAKKTVEDFFINSLNAILKEEIGKDTDADCRRWIEGMILPPAKEDEIKSAVVSYYESFLHEGDNAMMALSKALQIALYTFEYRSNSPSAFCRVLGVRCGLVGPKGNRANIKRYLINSFTLETITLSALSTEDLKAGIEFKDLSDRFITAYNILIGSDAESEYALLEQCNIAQATPGDLRGDLSLNAQCFANTYISLGFGKRYADGVTLIGWRL